MRSKERQGLHRGGGDEMKDFATLARQATEALLEQKMLTVRHEAGWKREGFPLPVKRMPASHDGSVVQDYRPMAILEYVQELLSGELAARRARDRRTKEPA